MPRASFLDEIDSRVIVCDGAMGTMLYAKGIFLNRSFDELNLTQPDLVAEVHQQYVRAGADLIETNTFGANRRKLAALYLEDELVRINESGVKAAREAREVSGRDVFVAGSIGPLGELEAGDVADHAAVFAEQAQILEGRGVDLFMIETFFDLEELVAAVAAVREVSSLPIGAREGVSVSSRGAGRGLIVITSSLDSITTSPPFTKRDTEAFAR